MLDLNQADWILLAIAALIAVAALVRMMRARRDQLLAQVRDQMETEKRRRLADERRQKHTTSVEKTERKAS